MFLKLDKGCIVFDACGIHMMGNPCTGQLFGLNENGYELTLSLLKGCDISKEDCSGLELQLIDAYEQSGLLNSTCKSPRIRTVYIHVTSRCNMNCSGCYSRFSRKNQKEDEMSTSDIMNIVDKLSGANVSTIVVSGGEPFLRDDLVAILRYMKCEKKIPKVFCISNGSASFTKYKEAIEYLDGLSFSLDGHSRESSYLRKDSFDNVVKTIKQLKRNNWKPGIIFTVHKKNYKNISDMKNFAESLEVGYSFSVFTTERGKETSEYELFGETIPDFVKYAETSGTHISDTPLEDGLGCRVCCGAGSTMLSISANGDIMPCHMFYEKKFLLGNALVDDLSEILDMEREPLFSVEQKSHCKKCEYKYLCGGGCLFRSYIFTGRLQDTDPLCPLFTSSIERTIRMLIG